MISYDTILVFNILIRGKLVIRLPPCQLELRNEVTNLLCTHTRNIVTAAAVVVAVAVPVAVAVAVALLCCLVLCENAIGSLWLTLLQSK